MPATVIHIYADGESPHIPLEPEGIEFLLHQLEASQHREEMFKQAMMKAQSQCDLMRRFIRKHGRQAKFALFVIGGRTHSRRTDVLAEFGFTADDQAAADDTPE